MTLRVNKLILLLLWGHFSDVPEESYSISRWFPRVVLNVNNAVFYPVMWKFQSQSPTSVSLLASVRVERRTSSYCCTSLLPVEHGTTFISIDVSCNLFQFWSDNDREPRPSNAFKEKNGGKATKPYGKSRRGQRPRAVCLRLVKRHVRGLRGHFK